VVLDIGTGVGSVHLALLQAGASRAVDVDASGDYLRLQRHRVRAAVIPVDELDRIIRQTGPSPCFSSAVGPAWQVLL
jgi:predicted RNA methylase